MSCDLTPEELDALERGLTGKSAFQQAIENREKRLADLLTDAKSKGPTQCCRCEKDAIAHFEIIDHGEVVKAGLCGQHLHQQTKLTATKRPGRNEPCICGSGKKFKHCHGKPKNVEQRKQGGSPAPNHGIGISHGPGETIGNPSGQSGNQPLKEAIGRNSSGGETSSANTERAE